MEQTTASASLESADGSELQASKYSQSVRLLEYSVNEVVQKLSLLRRARIMPVLYELFISRINRPRGIQLETISLWICR